MTLAIKHTLEKMFMKGESNGTQGHKSLVCLKKCSCYPKCTLDRHKWICWVWYKGNILSASVNNKRVQPVSEMTEHLMADWDLQDKSVGFVLGLLGRFADNTSWEDLKGDPSWVEMKHPGKAAWRCVGLCGWWCQSPKPSVWCSPQMFPYKPNCLSQLLAWSFLTSALSHAAYVNPEAKNQWRCFQTAFMFSQYLPD